MQTELEQGAISNIVFVIFNNPFFSTQLRSGEKWNLSLGITGLIFPDPSICLFCYNISSPVNLYFYFRTD